MSRIEDPYNEQYHSYEIHGSYNGLQQISYSYSFFVYKDNKEQFKIIVYIEHITAITQFKNNDKGKIEKLKSEGINYIQAKIDLQKFTKGHEYKFSIGQDLSKFPTTQTEVQYNILLALRNVKYLVPRNYRQETINVNGICNLLGIQEDDFFRAVNELYDEEKIDSPKDVNTDFPKGNIFITSKGIESFLSLQRNKDLEKIRGLKEFNRKLLTEESTVPQVNLLFKSISGFIKNLSNIDLESKLTKIKIKEAYGAEVIKYLQMSIEILNEAEEIIMKALKKDSLTTSPALVTYDEWENLKEGDLRIFCFLSVDIVGHSAIENPHREKENTFNEFERHVKQKVTENSGRVFSWLGDGGLCAFLRNDPTAMAEQGVQCATSIMESLEEFNTKKNSLTEPVKIRIAIHMGDARYREATGSIQSDSINFVAHLEKQKTLANTVSISGEIYRQLSGNLRSLFYKNGLFEGKEIFTSKKDIANETTPYETIKGQDSLKDVLSVKNIFLTKTL